MILVIIPTSSFALSWGLQRHRLCKEGMRAQSQRCEKNRCVCVWYRSNAAAEMVVSQNRRRQYRPHYYTILLIVGTPRRYPKFSETPRSPKPTVRTPCQELGASCILNCYSTERKTLMDIFVNESLWWFSGLSLNFLTLNPKS